MDGPSVLIVSLEYVLKLFEWSYITKPAVVRRQQVHDGSVNQGPSCVYILP